MRTPSLPRLRAATVIAVALACVAAAPAQADLKQDGRFVFAPYTGNDDPVSALLFGGLGSFCPSRLHPGVERSPYCLRNMIQASWRANGEIRHRFCNRGGDTLRFRNRDARQTRRADLEISTSGTCRRQYHVRMWGDYFVNARREWTVATVHRETRPWWRLGHDINMHWESAEEVLAMELRRRSTDDPDERRFCVKEDWRPVSGQRPGRHRGWINNGRITRISSQQPDPETGCRGA